MPAESRRGGAPSPARVVALLALVAAASFIAFWVVKVAAANLFLKDKFAVALPLALNDPRVSLTLSLAQVIKGNGAVSPDVLSAVRKAAVRAPLTEEPYLISGMAALAAGDERRGQSLLTRAREINPRSRLARIFLLDRYLRIGRIDAAATELAVVSELIPKAGKFLLPELAKLAATPESRPALKKVLATKPVLLRQLLEHLASTGATPALAIDLWTGAGKPDFQESSWRETIIQRQIKNGDLSGAYSIWKQFAPAAEADGNEIYDAQFQLLSAPPPFGWKLSDGEGGVADPQPGGALEVEYFARDATVLASQLLVLKPGTYRLAVTATGTVPADESRLFWSIRCQGSDAPLTQLALIALQDQPQKLTARFVVPPRGCAAQSLSLRGMPGEFSKPSSATLRNLEIGKAQ